MDLDFAFESGLGTIVPENQPDQARFVVVKHCQKYSFA
jgi:hypothetical protein